MLDKLHEFDPDFSEYNPIVEELREVKEVQMGGFKKFFSNLIKRLNTEIVVQTD